MPNGHLRSSRWIVACLLATVAIACSAADDVNGTSAASNRSSSPDGFHGDGFAIDLPEGFTAGGGGAFGAEMLASREADPFGSTIMVFHDEMGGRFPLAKVMAAYRRKVTQYGVRVDRADVVEIDGRPAGRLRYDDPEVDLRTEAYVIPVGQDAWILEFTAGTEGFADLAAAYRQSASSFRLTGSGS